MSEISLRKGIVLFLLIFILPAVLLQPIRPAIVGLLPQPTLWQSVSMSLSTVLVTGLAVYAWNLREKIKELEREVERQKYHAQNNIGD